MSDTFSRFLCLFGLQAEPAEELLIAVRRGVAGRQQFFPVEDRVRAGEKAQRLHLVTHVLAAGGQAHVRGGHQNARDGDGAHEVDRVNRGGLCYFTPYCLLAGIVALVMGCI